MWVGRATVFMVGLAVTLALILGVASSALGADGKPFLLGKRNVATAVSTLVKKGVGPALDRKSTRLNSSHANISYAVFCLKKKTGMEYMKFIASICNSYEG